MTSAGPENYDNYPFFRNCEKATEEPIYGTLHGSIPSWLEGELVRVGPGIQKVGNEQYRHMFDGLAILHKFRIQDGKASYQSRPLNSDCYQKAMEANRIVVSEFGTRAHPDPCQSLFGRLKTEFLNLATVLRKSERENQITDNCCVNVGYYGDQLYAMTETNMTRRIDPDTLNTIGNKTDINDYVAVNSATAHPHVLPDGTVINVGNIYRHQRGPHYGFIKVPPSFGSDDTSYTKAKLIAEIPSRWRLHTAYFHSFGITDTGKLIFIEFPYCVNLLALVTGVGLGINKKSYQECIQWYPNEKARFYVVSMEDGKIHSVTYETDNLFLFHHINAYEEDGEIVVDVSGYSDAETTKPGVNLVKTGTATAMLREENKKIVDLTPQHFTEDMLELARINYKFNGKKYKYFYGLSQKVPAETYEFGMDIICKVDVSTGEKLCWYADTNSRASEPIFVPDPTKENPDEDDGVLLAALLPNDKPKNVSLLILNAKDMTEIGRTDFSALGAITGTFHGIWANSGDKMHSY